MIRMRVERVLFGVALAAVTMTAVGARAQGVREMLMQHPEMLRQHPPLSYPMSQYLRTNPEAARALISPQSVPSPESGEAPGTIESGKGASPQADPASPWQLLSNPLGTIPCGSDVILTCNASNPLLLTDGTVIVHISETVSLSPFAVRETPFWWRLTPDINGSYVNGTWSPIASLPSGYAPRFFASAVLPDGRVIVEGGEYNNPGGEIRTNLGAIYDPIAKTWKPVTQPNGWAHIGDAASVVLPNGTFMLADCCTKQQALFNAHSPDFSNPLLTWTATGSGKFDSNNEEGWTLLWDGDVLTVDTYVPIAGVFPGGCDTNSELYLTLFGSWISAGSTIQQLPDCSGPNLSYEMGPQVLRPDGTVIAFGGTTPGVAHTAIFNSLTPNWAAGPDIPTVSSTPYTLADAPAALLPSGNVLFAASPSNWQTNGFFPPPTHFFEVAYGTNTVSQVADPSPSDVAATNSYQWNFLVLPTGQILACETDFPNVWIYTPSGSPDPSWAPHITGITPYNFTFWTGSTYLVYGRQFNGLSQGAAYGDDVQAATNYPLVRIVNATTGHVFYARTFGHSTMGIGPEDDESNQVYAFTNFTVPTKSAIEAGYSYLYVVANGIASQPFLIYISPLG